ncbi:hypothetical protein PVAP13_7KG196855 [Panicum virgatum]|uniref:Uncharacterized protein n=1 Tax=Panicum virgatum TaxID=38727 RepID=A0A8T0QF66_PANVG|nr:hypothetical protein PVAP13_7KG196855 [Panicum virgatum]
MWPPHVIPFLLLSSFATIASSCSHAGPPPRRSAAALLLLARCPPPCSPPPRSSCSPSTALLLLLYPPCSPPRAPPALRFQASAVSSACSHRKKQRPPPLSRSIPKPPPSFMATHTAASSVAASSTSASRGGGPLTCPGARPAAARLARCGRPPARSAGDGAARSMWTPARVLRQRRRGSLDADARPRAPPAAARLARCEEAAAAARESTERQHGGGGCEGRRRAGLRSARVEPPEVEWACPLPPPSTVALDQRRCGSLHTDARPHARPAAARLAPCGCRPARSAGDEQGGPPVGEQDCRPTCEAEESGGGQKGPYGNTVGEETRSYVCN